MCYGLIFAESTSTRPLCLTRKGKGALGEFPHGGSQDSKDRRGNLAKRILVGAILIPIVLYITHVGGMPFTVFVSFLALIAYAEFNRMFSSLKPSLLLGAFSAFSICLAFGLRPEAVTGVTTSVLLVILIERLVRVERDDFAVSIGSSFLGVIYTGWLLGHFILLRNIPAISVKFKGSDFVYLVLILTWTYDTVAYVVGTFIGRRRIFTRISPSKTLEGTLAGLGGCVLASLVSRATFLAALSVANAIAIGLVVAFFGQLGDLVESMFKRSMGVKDSSHILPGHGGILDRFDSLLFAGPIMYYYVKLVLL